MRRWTPQDLARFREGRHFDLHELLGAHWLGPRTVFRVWAPDATRVSVVGAFNHGDGQACPMARVLGSDVWRVSVPGVALGDGYAFRIQGPDELWNRCSASAHAAPHSAFVF